MSLAVQRNNHKGGAQFADSFLSVLMFPIFKITGIQNAFLTVL